MNIKQIEKILIEGGIEPNEARIEAKMLVKHFLGLSGIDLMMNEEFDDEKQPDVVLNLIQHRIDERPCDPETSSGRRMLIATQHYHKKIGVKCLQEQKNYF